MSFTLTYKTLANQNFVPALKKVVNFDGFKDPKLAYNAARIGSLVDQELKTFHDLRVKFANKVKAIKPENEENPTDADKEAVKALQEEADKFGEVSFEINRHKLKLEDLSGLKLTPNEILALEPMLEGLE